MNVDAADVTVKPLIYGIYKLPGVRTIIALRDETLLKPCQGPNELLVLCLVHLCHGTLMFCHAPLLETKVAATIDTEIIEHHGVHLTAQTFVKSGAKIFGHLENQLVILVDLLDTSSVILTPFHLFFLNPVQHNDHTIFYSTYKASHHVDDHICEPGMMVTDCELSGFCREHLAKYKTPKTIFIRDELPMLPIG